MAFVADSGNAVTVLGTAVQGATTASSTQYLGFGSPPLSATELPVAIPIPFAGTFQYFAMCDSTNPTATVAVTFRDNGANVGTPGNIGFTLPSATTGCNGWDPTNTFAASVGDYVDIQTVSGATTQTNINWAAISYTPTTGTPELVWGMVNASIGPAATDYTEPFVTNFSATEGNVQMAVPRACTASKFYIVLGTNQGSTPVVTVTLRDNGANTALTGTVTGTTTAGVIALDLTHTVALAQGDRIDVLLSNTTGTSGTYGGWAFQCQ
jgi:hypothetical protein